MECYICFQPVTGISNFFYHLRSFHNISTNSKDIQCPYKDCYIFLQTTRGIKKHMNNFHKTETQDNEYEVNSIFNNTEHLNPGKESELSQLHDADVNTNAFEDNYNNRIFIESIKISINSLITELNGQQIPRAQL